MANNNNNNWKRIGGFSRTGTQNYVRTNDAAMGGTTFGSTDVSYNTGNSTLRIGNNAGVVFINGDIDMSGGPGVGAPINRVRNVRDPIVAQDVATKHYVDTEILAITSLTGIQGPKGEQGPPGIGFSGQNGSEGPTGVTGCTGAIGPPGSVIGVVGPTGANGGTGATGAAGVAGATGPVGAQGTQGIQGIQGTQGIQGSNGAILWLNPDGDSTVNQLITDSYLLSTVPVVSTMRKVGPISVSATYGNALRMIPGNRFWNTALKASTLAVIPSGVWVLNLYANVPSNSDANQVALYAAAFMITGTTNQPSPDSLIIETKDGGDAGYYPPRAAYLPDHVKYIGRSWTDDATTLSSKTSGAVIESTTRKLYKIEMPVEFTTLKDANGNTEHVYIQLQIYIKNTTAANQTANVNLYYQTDLNTNETTYSYLQTTFGAVGIQGTQGTTGSDGRPGATGSTGTAGTIGPTGSAGPTGHTGAKGPEGDRGQTGPTGPAGQSNSVGRQYTVQYRSNVPVGGPTDDADESGSFAGNANFRFLPTASTTNASDATTGTVVLNDLACRSVHSSFYIEDPSITGSTRPRTFVKGGENVSGSGGGYIVLASGRNTADGGTTSSPATVADITHGFKLVHNIGSTPPTVTFNLHNNNKTSANIGMKFDVTNGNIIAAQDKFCVVNSSGAVGMGGITPAELTAESSLNRALHVRGNVMVGTHPGGTAATSAMILLNKATTTPPAPLSSYPGVYHRSIDTSESTAVGSIAAGTEGLGIISPNFITFQTGSTLGNNSVVINQTGDVSVTGRANLNGPVSVGKNFAAVTSHTSGGVTTTPNIDVSGIIHISSAATTYTDNPRIKLISNAININSDIPTATTANTANEIRGVNTANTTGFLRLTAQTPANSCIDLIGVNTDTVGAKFSNSVRISTAGVDRMVVNGIGNVGIGTTSPTVALDVTGAVKIAGELNMSSNKITNVTNPTANQDAATKLYVDGALTGGSIVNNPTVTDVLNVNNTYRVLFTTATSGRATLNHDAQLSYNPSSDILYAGTFYGNATSATKIAGELNMSSNKITNVTNPTANQDAATKIYVDGAASAATAVGNAAQTTANTANTTANGLVVATSPGSATARAQDLYPASGIGAGIITQGLYRLYVPPTGNVAIGGTVPLFPLHVFGNVFGNPTGSNAFTLTNLTSVTGYRNISICAQDGEVAASNFAAYSDKRIKKNINSLDPDKCVKMVRDLNPVSYNYIDYITNSTCNMYGFIAQDVKAHIPDAISYKTDYVPNIYSQVKLSKYPYNTNTSLWKVTLIISYTETGKFTFYPNKDNSGNEYVSIDGSPLSDSIGNQRFKIKFITYDISGSKNELICYTHKIINDTEFLIDATSIDNQHNPESKEMKFEEKEYFLYGQEVDDFHNLTYDHLWTVFGSCLKEVDRQQQADKTRIAELENQVSTLEATVATQQSLINDILERLKSNGM